MKRTSWNKGLKQPKHSRFMFGNKNAVKKLL